eukprot:5441445-Lingulodinium_polyedra.AAC.1
MLEVTQELPDCQGPELAEPRPCSSRSTSASRLGASTSTWGRSEPLAWWRRRRAESARTPPCASARTP